MPRENFSFVEAALLELLSKSKEKNIKSLRTERRTSEYKRRKLLLIGITITRPKRKRGRESIGVST